MHVVEQLVELGAVTEAATDNGQLYQGAAEAYLSATKQGRSALLVSPTWAEIEAVSEKVREVLKVEGVVTQDEQTVCVFDSLSWTQAQKKNTNQYEPVNACALSEKRATLIGAKRSKS